MATFEVNSGVGPTHDYKWLKEFIPAELRARRRLSKIENGVNSHQIALVKWTLPVPKKIETWWTIPGYPSLSIWGEVIKIEQMVRRIYRLSESKQGKLFLEKLISLGERILVEIVEKGGLTQIIVRVDGNEDFDDAFMPLEWCSWKNHKEVESILDSIRQGGDFIRIEKTHPHKDVIFDHLVKLSARPPGRRLLIDLKGIVTNYIQIAYENGCNNFMFSNDQMENSTLLFDNFTESEAASIEKKTGRAIPIPHDPVIRLGHELIHALHAYRMLSHRFDPMKEAVFDPKTATFVFTREKNKAYYPHYTNPEEQETILGDEESRDVSENALRYASGLPLRWGHKFWNLELSEDRELMTPCNPLFMGDFPRDYLQVAILKREGQACEIILRRMGIRDLDRSIKKVEEVFQELDCEQQDVAYQAFQFIKQKRL